MEIIQRLLAPFLFAMVTPPPQWHSLPEFLRANGASLILLLVLFQLAIFVRSCFHYQRTRLLFPKIPPERILFDQRSASGHSYKTFFTRIGGASRCLHVTGTDTEVWLRLIFPFNFLAQQCDLEHRIQKKSITHLQPQDTFFRTSVLLDYRDERGRTHRLNLVLNDREKFLKAMGDLPKPNH